MIEDGIYGAIVTNWGITETQAGLPQVVVSFDVKAKEGMKPMSWFGSLKEGKAREITIDALLTCGFSGDDVADIAKSVEGKALELGREVSVTVGTEADLEGKDRQRIRWVNPIGGGAFRNKISHGDAVSKLKGMNLKGEILARRQQRGKSPADEAAPF